MKVLWQIGVILGICLIGEGIAHLLPIPFPSSVISMILLFILLLTKRVESRHLIDSSNFLIRNMSFLFIPDGVGVMRVFDSIKGSLLQLLTVCIVSTVITFAVTSYTVRGVIRLQEWARAHRGRRVESANRHDARFPRLPSEERAYIGKRNG